MKKKGRSFINGIFILMISQLIIKTTGLVYKIFLTNKEGFGDSGNAILSAGFQVYSLFLAITSIGIPNAISQLISSKVAMGDNRGAYRVFKIAISIFGIIGFTGTTILFLGANKIANQYLGIPDSEFTIMALAPSIFIVAISSVLRGYFNGIEMVNITAHSQSIEQILKTVITIAFVEIIGYASNRNTRLMVATTAITTTIATFFGFTYLFIIYKKNKKKIWKDVIESAGVKRESIMKIIKSIVYLSLPMTITSLLAATNRTIDALTIVRTMSQYMPAEQAKIQYGILTGKVESLVVLPYSFNVAFSISLIPTIAAANARKNMDCATKKINFSILATVLIALPCMGIFISFAEQILKFLFPNAYLGKEMLKLSSVSIIFVAITQTIGGILQGLKKVKEPAIAIGLGTMVKIILNYVLIPIKKLNIYGAIIATIVGHIVTFVVSVYYFRKYLILKIDLKNITLKPAIATIIMIFGAIELYKLNLIKSPNINLIISLSFGFLMYIFSIIILRIFPIRGDNNANL